MLALTIAATVHIGVFGSFHPKSLEIRPALGSVLAVQTQGHTEVIRAPRWLRISGPAHVTGVNGDPVRFVLGVPGVLRREYVGRLEVRPLGQELLAIVEMDRETAVASILAGEGASALAPEARKAQAIVTRSYLTAARGRHEGFDFCDTTHCQRLHAPPSATSPSARAVRATRGRVLVYQGSVVPALYSANCGGRTRTPIDVGWMIGGYPYFPIACPRKGDASGHGIGFCQLGGQDMARRGAKFPEILGHFFPQTTIESVFAKNDQEKNDPAQLLSRVWVPAQGSKRAVDLLR
jgi:hypothetical protein